MKNYNEFLKAKELANKEKYRDAIIILKRLCKFEPNDLILKFELARLLIKNEDTKIEGKLLLEELLDTENKAYAMIELGKLKLEEENKKEARKYFLLALNTENKAYAMIELGKLELKEDNVEKSRYYLEEALNISNEEEKTLELGKLDPKDKSFALMQLIYLEIKNKDYIKAYNYFEKLTDYSCLNKNEIKEINFYLKYKLNLLTEEDKKNKGYFCNQLLNYDEEKALEHIKLHLDENNCKRKHTIYNKTLNINIVFNDIKIRIYDMTPDLSTLVDKYIIEYDYIIGSINNIETNTLKVVTFSNTKNILTMYPIIKGSKKDIINKTSTYEEKDKVKQIKRESQIDKFNRKYGLK